MEDQKNYTSELEEFMNLLINEKGIKCSNFDAVDSLIRKLKPTETFKVCLPEYYVIRLAARAGEWKCNLSEAIVKLIDYYDDSKDKLILESALDVLRERREILHETQPK